MEDRTSRGRALDALLSDPVAQYRFLVEESSDILAIHEPTGRLRWVSPSIQRMLGWTPEERMSGEVSLIHPDDEAAVLAVNARLFEGDDEGSARIRLQHKDGHWVWGLSTARAWRDDAGDIVALAIVTHDIDDVVRAEQERHAAERAREESHAQYRLLAESNAHFTVRVDGRGLITWVSPSVEAVLGWTPEQLVGTPGASYLHHEQQHEVASARAALRAGDGLSGRARFRRSDGSYVWVSQVVTPLFDEDGAYSGLVSGFQNIDAEVRAERELAASEERFRRVMAFAPAGMAVAGLDRQMIMVNPALCRLLVRDEKWLLSHTTLDVVHHDDLDAVTELRARLDAGEQPEPVEVRVVTGTGQIVWVQLGTAVLHDGDGVPSGILIQLVDVTRAHRAREQLRELATHDQLTGALHRAPLEEVLERMLGRPGRAGRAPAVLYLDVDGLGRLNNDLGHPAGDQLLINVADRLRGELRVDDLLARFGGDEFVVVLPGIASRQDARHVADKLHLAVGKLLDVDGHEVRPAISIGIAMARDGDSVKRLVKRADEALLNAKRWGKNCTADDADL